MAHGSREPGQGPGAAVLPTPSPASHEPLNINNRLINELFRSSRLLKFQSFQSIKLPKFPSSKVSNFQSFKFSKFQTVQVSKCPSFKASQIHILKFSSFLGHTTPMFWIFDISKNNISQKRFGIVSCIVGSNPA